MKKALSMGLILALVFALAGCITIVRNDPSEQESTKATRTESSTETSTEVETRAPESETEAPVSTEVETTEMPTGNHNPEEPETDESGMRYSYKWLSGYYKTHNTTEKSEGWIPNFEIMFYENGAFSADCAMFGYNAGYIGNYYIIGDTIYLQTWLTTGGSVEAVVIRGEAEENAAVMGINMDGTLISGTFYQENMVLTKGTSEESAMFESEHGWLSILRNRPLYNDFSYKYPDF